MSVKYIKGDEIQLFLGNDSVPSMATSHTLTLSTDITDINHKDLGENGASESGKKSWELSGDFLYSNNDFDTFFDYWRSGQKLKIKFARVRNFSNKGLTSFGGDMNKWYPELKGYEGYVIVSDLSASANTGENATFSVTFKGSGPIKEYSNTQTIYVMAVIYNVKKHTTVKLWNDSAKWGIASVTNDDEHVVYTSDDNTYTNNTSSDKYINMAFYLISNTITPHLFEGIDCIYSVGIPSTSYITTVGEFAFRGSSLTEFDDSDDMITRIEKYAFAGSLIDDWMGASHIKYIGDFAFFNVIDMVSFNLGDSIEYVGKNAFDYINHGDKENMYITVYTEFAPNIGAFALGIPQELTIRLGNSTKQTFLQNNTWQQYSNATWINI